MFRTARSAWSVSLLSGLVAACATEPPAGSTGHSGYKVGVPYRIGDNWYYPQEQQDYDETGIASWYGPTFYGKPTANGEIFEGDGLTAAHRTLPLPVNVRVTNLENGKSLVVRVNDRGPFAKGRIIDVSKHAAELLGFYAKGTAKVRVTYLGRADVPVHEAVPDAAPEDDDTVDIAQATPPPRAHKAQIAPHKPSTSTVQVAALQPPPMSPQPAATEPQPAEQMASPAKEDAEAAAADPPARPSHLYVQVGSFSSQDNAERLKTRLADAGLPVPSTEEDPGKLHRVRLGPYDDLESANAALAKLNELGNNGAKIVFDR